MPLVPADDPDDDLLALLAAVQRDYAQWLARHGRAARARALLADAEAIDDDLCWRRAPGHDDGPPDDDFDRAGGDGDPVAP